MVGFRAPERLEAAALSTWLRALNTAAERGEDISARLKAPPTVLSAALSQSQGTMRLREVVVARLAVAAVKAGVSQLGLHLQQPTLVQAFVEALHAHPKHLRSLIFTLDPRISFDGLMSKAMRRMTNLTMLVLTPVVTDIHLAALAHAAPPLGILDLSYCSGVTDKGMFALLGLVDYVQPIKEVVISDVERKIAPPASTLHTIKLCGTGVTTRGCVLLLATCPALSSFTCRWLGEALDLSVRAGRNVPLKLRQLNLANSSLPSLAPVVALCPHLTSLEVSQPPDILSVKNVLSELPTLTSLKLIDCPPQDDWLPSFPVSHLTYLFVKSVKLHPVQLSLFANTFPSLTFLQLEGVILTLPYPPPPPPFCKIECLRLGAPFMNHGSEVMEWALVWASGVSSIRMGDCRHLTDQHLKRALSKGALSQAKEVLLSGVQLVSDAAIKDMIEACPRLRHLSLVVPMERLADMESLKITLRTQNLDVELSTLGCNY